MRTTMWTPRGDGSIHPHCPRCGSHVEILQGEGVQNFERYYECIARCGWAALLTHEESAVYEELSDRVDESDPFCYAATGKAPRFGKYSHTWQKDVWDGDAPVEHRR